MVMINVIFRMFSDISAYAGAVKLPVRRTGNRESGHKKTRIFAAEPLSQREDAPGQGCLLL